ncbi:AI-2E family transporter [candidate division WWE3 bacterium]|nr:AI-2E family transporter [candidate division WWE3 bacterium]
MAQAHIEINTRFVFRLIVFIILFALAFLIYDILFLLFVAYIIMASVSPLVIRLEKRGVPRGLGILGIYLLVFSIIGFFTAISLPPLITQMQSFLFALPEFIRRSLESIKITHYVDESTLQSYLRDFVQSLSVGLTNAPASIIRISLGVFGRVLDVIMVMVFAFYLTMERESVRRSLVRFIPYQDKKELRTILEQVDFKLGAWLRGQLLLMFIIGGITYLGLVAIGMPFPMPLAIIAGCLEIVPIIGPIISVFPALLIALAYSPILAATVAGLYILIQQSENHIIVPRVMKHAVGLDPLLVIVSLLIGGRLAGVMGSLIAVPVTAILLIIYREWQRAKASV